MRQVRFLFGAALTMALWSLVSAHAEEKKLASLQIETLYASGQYDEVVQGAEAAPTADSLAIAARAVLAEVICRETDPPLARLKRAEALARSALRLDPQHVEGRLQLAISLSLQARSMSLGEARRSGYGELTRDLVESVLRDDPTNPYAHSFLAIWHFEVRRRGGSVGASIMGASVNRGIWHYEQAALYAPDDAAIHWQFARALTALNPKKYEDWISLALTRAQHCEEDTQAEASMRARALELAGIRQSMKRNALKSWAAERL